jgi:hypothetical protein
MPIGTSNHPSRFDLVEITPPGASGSGHEPQIGTGGAVPLKIIVPATQTANAIEVRSVTGALLFSVGANGGPAPNVLTASGAIPVRPSASYVIGGTAAIKAFTLAAPTPGTDDGVTITLTSSTGFAHTLTATGLLQTGSAAVNVATFATFPGATLTLQAYNGKWQVISSNGIAFT